MLDLINQLNSADTKVEYQEFLIEMGISRATVHVPIKNSYLFEEAARAETPTTKSHLTKLVKAFGGTIES